MIAHLGYLKMLLLMKSPPALFSRLYELRWYKEMLEQWVEPVRTADARILEVGCATGGFARSLADQGAEVWAVDMSLRVLARARKPVGAVRFLLADARHLPFSEGSFDVALAASLINVVDAPCAVLAEMRWVCRTGGIVSILVPSRSFSDHAAKRYIAAERLSGFSSAAFSTWHRVARKMDPDVMCGYFQDCGMYGVDIEELLGGMVISVSGRVA